MENREFTGKFDIERKKCANGNYRTIAKEVGGGKERGSTFDEDLGERLAAFGNDTTVTLIIDTSGKYWNIVDVRLADVDKSTSNDAGKTSTSSSGGNTSGGGGDVFKTRELTYFMGNAARLIAVRVDKGDYADETGTDIEAIATDTVTLAKLMLKKANQS